MTKAHAVVAFAGVGTLGFAVLGMPAAAFAAPSCGVAPAGAVLTQIGNVCQLDFVNAGVYSWAVPRGLTGLYAVVAGAGGGGFYTTFPSPAGYAGGGGRVTYADLTSVAGAPTATITVGAGGRSDGQLTEARPLLTAPGQASSVSVGATTTSAAGGSPGTDDTLTCGYPESLSTFPLDSGIYAGYFQNGDGASGGRFLGAENLCVNGYRLGLSPATEADSTGTPVLPIFSSFNTVLGAGGRAVLSLDPSADLLGTGRGADAIATGQTTFTGHDFGGSGRVVIRFLAVELADAGGTALIPPAGADVSGLLAGAGVLGVLGALALVLGRRREAAKHSHN